MTLSANTAKYLEYSLLTVGISLVFIILIIQFEQFAPLTIAGIAIAGIFIYLGAQIQGSFLLFYFLLSISFLENNEGIQPIEIPFYVISLIMILYVATEIISGRIILETLLDKLFLFLLLLLPYGVILGIINGGSAYTALGEATNYFGVLLYFPIRKHLSNKNFQRFLFGITITIIAFVLIRNLINYQEIVARAILPWQAEKARSSANEFILLLGAFLTMSAAAVIKSMYRQLFFTILFICLIGGLVLTQSRGYWLAFIFGAFFIFCVINRTGKFNIGLTFVILTSGAFLLATFFFNDLLDLVIGGLAARFQTLGSGKLDVSLLERFLESKTVFKLIIQNPIAGYGMGYTFTKKILFFDIFITTSYVHNGYLASWFKLGLPGLFTIISIWFLNIRYAFKLYKKTDKPKDQIIALTIVGTISGILLVNNTSPQVLLFESILFVTVFSAYLSTQLDRIKEKS